MRVRATGKAAVLPKPAEVPEDPGPLPQPARRTSAYFEVRAITNLHGARTCVDAIGSQLLLAHMLCCVTKTATPCLAPYCRTIPGPSKVLLMPT